MALAAAQMALDDASVDPSTLDPYRMSVITSSASGGNEFGQREIQNLWGKGPIFVGAYQSIAWFYAATTGQISIKYGMKGPCGVLVSEGAGGLEALWHSRRTIRRGVDVVVSGGTEAPIGPYRPHVPAAERPPERGARAGGRLPAVRPARQRLRARARAARSSSSRGPTRARSGARRRSTARSSGYAATNDAHDPQRVPTDGRHLARAMSLAIERAGIGPDGHRRGLRRRVGRPRVGPGRGGRDQGASSAGGEGSGHGSEVDDRPALRRWAPLDVAAALLAIRDGVHAADDQSRRACGGLRARLRHGQEALGAARQGARERARLRRLQQRHGARTNAPVDDRRPAPGERSPPSRPTALAWAGARLSYGEFDEAVDVLAAGIGSAAGDVRGRPVALIAPNTPAFVVGALRDREARRVAVPLNARLREHELRQILADAEPAALVSVECAPRLLVPRAHRAAAARAAEPCAPASSSIRAAASRREDAT